MTVLAIDFAIIAIIAFCGWRGYRNGLIRGVFGIVALIVSVFVANIAAEAYSEEFTGMLNPFVGGIIDSALNDADAEDSEPDIEESDYISEYISKHISENNGENSGKSSKKENSLSVGESEKIVKAYLTLRRIGLPKPAAARIAMLSADNETGELLSDVIADKVSSVLAYIAVFAIAFILLAIVFAVVGNLIGFVFSLPGLKLLDSIAGVVFGLAKGLLIVFTLATVARYFGLLALDTIEETSLLNYLINNNPVANMLGL